MLSRICFNHLQGSRKLYYVTEFKRFATLGCSPLKNEKWLSEGSFTYFQQVKKSGYPYPKLCLPKGRLSHLLIYTTRGLMHGIRARVGLHSRGDCLNPYLTAAAAAPVLSRRSSGRMSGWPFSRFAYYAFIIVDFVNFTC